MDVHLFVPFRQEEDSFFSLVWLLPRSIYISGPIQGLSRFLPLTILRCGRECVGGWRIVFVVNRWRTGNSGLPRKVESLYTWLFHGADRTFRLDKICVINFVEDIQSPLTLMAVNSERVEFFFFWGFQESLFTGKKSPGFYEERFDCDIRIIIVIDKWQYLVYCNLVSNDRSSKM